jgi:peptidoglycan hydrolase-like protein with peptidoglycan-binding domain
MIGLAVRAACVVGCGALMVTLAAVPAGAANEIDVTLQPTFAPVGATVHISSATDLSDADEVRFGSSGPVTPTNVDQTSLDAVVPSDATTGPLTVGFSIAPDATTNQSFTVQLPATAAVAKSRSLVRYPDDVTVSGTLKAAGIGVAGKKARLQRAAAGTTSWANIRRAKTTDGDGKVRWTFSPRDTADYRVAFPANPQYLAARSSRVRVQVSPKVVLKAPAVAPIYTRTSLPGRVRPAPRDGGRVVLDQRIDGVWHRADVTHTADDGRFVFKTTFETTGRYVYRVRRPADATHVSGQSAKGVVAAVKRTLHSGDTGPDVLALQKRLRTLHYDVGRADSHYGYDTLHAVVAFQKVQGIDRDGVVGPRVWRRLADPRAPKLRHPEDAASTGVEVDLTKQVVYYAVDGKVRAVIDASSGGGYYYTGSDGTTQKAVTPTGHYSFLYKYDDADHWQHAPLGELYKPAYFRNDGYAIHGSNSIPPYPASHGCVRISVPAMDRFTDRFTIGMSVWLYHS